LSAAQSCAKRSWEMSQFAFAGNGEGCGRRIPWSALSEGGGVVAGMLLPAP
jgi:hypothetical protein